VATRTRIRRFRSQADHRIGSAGGLSRVPSPSLFLHRRGDSDFTLTLGTFRVGKNGGISSLCWQWQHGQGQAGGREDCKGRALALRLVCRHPWYLQEERLLSSSSRFQKAEAAEPVPNFKSPVWPSVGASGFVPSSSWPVRRRPMDANHAITRRLLQPTGHVSGAVLSAALTAAGIYSGRCIWRRLAAPPLPRSKIPPPLARIPFSLLHPPHSSEWDRCYNRPPVAPPRAASRGSRPCRIGAVTLRARHHGPGPLNPRARPPASRAGAGPRSTGGPPGPQVSRQCCQQAPRSRPPTPGPGYPSRKPPPLWS
jgi:hypothetical protein